MALREPKQSQLDYLWVNFGERGVITSSDSNNPDAIPSFGLMQELLSNICSKAVGSITKEDKKLIVKSVEGKQLDTINLEELGGAGIVDFGRRNITKEDIDAGSPYLLYQPVYYVKLSTGLEFTAPIDVYKGGENNIIKNTILNNTVYSELKLSDKIKGVVFSQEEDGLSGLVHLLNSTRGIRFAIVTKSEYLNMIHDMTTLYFIKNEPYLYFGETKLANNIVEDLDDIYDRLTNIEYLINWEENG